MEQQLKPLHLAALVDEMRPNMALIKIKNGIATATNGHILVRLDLTKTTLLEPDTIKLLDGKSIHAETWKEIHKADVLVFGETSIDCFKNSIKKTFYYGEPVGTLWDDEHVVLDVKKGGEEVKRIMSFNASLIAILKKIFESDTLHFSFSKGNLGTVVYPSHDSGMFAILMPVHVEGDDLNRYIFLNN